MIKLINIELIKIFHKKGVFLIWGIMLLFCFLNNILYYKDYDQEGFYLYLDDTHEEKGKTELVQELKKYDIAKESDQAQYFAIQSKLEILELKKNFSPKTWQYQLLDDYMYDCIYQKNLSQYLNLENSTDTLKNYQEKLNKLKTDDWKYFIQLELKDVQNQIDSLNNYYKDIQEKQEQTNIKKQLQDLNLQKKILRYRLNNNVKKERGYLNQALLDYEKNMRIINSMENEKELTPLKQKNYNEAYTLMKVNEYILNHKININQENTVSYQLRTISEDYEIFIVLLILLISSSIICEEFQKGTIKLLLIKPYSRGKILLSKFYACLVLLIISLLFLIIIQLIIGIPLFGTNSLKVPVVIYHFGKKKLVCYSIWKYMGIRLIYRLPFFILLINISFLVSVFATNAVLAATIPMMIYLFTTTVHFFLTTYHQNWLKYFISENWHLEQYLFGAVSDVRGANLKFSSLICIFYFLVMSVITIVIFYKKNIRNV